MKLTFIKPRPELRPCVESLWVFESDIGLPASDQSLAAPNGCPKLIIPYRNSLESTANARSQVSHEQGLYFVGNMETSTVIRSSTRPTGFIGIEFLPHGAFPIFGIPMQNICNGLFDSETLFGKWGRRVREALCNEDVVTRKVEFIQDELVRLLRGNSGCSALVEFSVRNLKLTDGRISIKELERKTGFTRQHLDSQFRRHVGLSPKTLAGIFRFQKFYRKWAQGLSFDIVRDELYDDYYDQAHFAKEFKRMTGYPPRQFSLEVSNEFGRHLSLK
jgi:AraC-like DNA-binding protein